MNPLKPFRIIPTTLVEWGRWFSAQDIPDPVSDTILTGGVSFIGATPQVVTLDAAEASVDYAVLIDGGVNETFWVTDKTTARFSINSSNSSSTTTVKWVLVR